MAKETKVVQVYPSNSRIQEKIKECELFGWEVIGNQRVQEYSGGVSDYLLHQKTYSTFVNLTFQREKSTSWYPKVVSLENEWYRIVARINEIWKPKRSAKMNWKRYLGYFFLSYMVLGVLLMSVTIILSQVVGNSQLFMENGLPLPVMVAMVISLFTPFIMNKIFTVINEKKKDPYSEEKKTLFARKKAIEQELRNLIR